jgi:hypothetical protein
MKRGEEQIQWRRIEEKLEAMSEAELDSAREKLEKLGVEVHD